MMNVCIRVDVDMSAPGSILDETVSWMPLWH